MLFNSLQFLLFFLPATLAAFFLARGRRPRLVVLLVASYVFYGYADRWFPVLMLASTAISWTGGRLVARGGHRKLVLAASVTALLALLGYFKYASFGGGYALDLVHLLTGTGFPGTRTFLHGIVLPIGISFYTFEGISYVVDVYRGDLEAEHDPLRYLLFISFFPHLIAGPIVRYGILRPQLERPLRHDWDRFRGGLLLFSLGLAKKVLLADGIAHYVNPLLASPGDLGFVGAWCAVVGFGFQIYFDFSGYSDMALGLARLFGIELPWNFDRPYRAASPGEFWRRWHVTLSTWLRDYLYIPLGGNRKGGARRDANLLATMSLGGLWHGASLNFVLWGVYQGLLLVGGRHASRLPVRLPRVAAVAVTFVLVMCGWVFFRQRTAEDIRGTLAAMAGAHGVGAFPGHLVLYLLVSAAIVFCLPEEWRWRTASWGSLRVAATAALAGVALLSLSTTHPFIYFQF